MKYLVFLLLGACASLVESGSQIKKVELPLIRVAQIVEQSLPEGKFFSSSNGREFVSNEFYPHGRHTHLWYTPKDKNRKHYFAHVLVLGSRRPYRVSVRVLEKTKQSVLSEEMVKTSRLNKKLSEYLANRVELNLNKGLKDLNVIDDFRVF